MYKWPDIWYDRILLTYKDNGGAGRAAHLSSLICTVFMLSLHNMIPGDKPVYAQPREITANI